MRLTDLHLRIGILWGCRLVPVWKSTMAMSSLSGGSFMYCAVLYLKPHERVRCRRGLTWWQLGKRHAGIRNGWVSRRSPEVLETQYLNTGKDSFLSSYSTCVHCALNSTFLVSFDLHLETFQVGTLYLSLSTNSLISHLTLCRLLLNLLSSCFQPSFVSYPSKTMAQHTKLPQLNT